MGLIRRVGWRDDNPAGANPGMASPERPVSARPGKESKLYVQPAELARKLVKEMEDHKVLRSAGVLVCNQYTVFLCRADYHRLGAHEDEITAALERHLAKRVRAKKYEIPGDITVALTMDPELSPGYFGILAERMGPVSVEREAPDTAPMTAVSPLVAAPRSRTRSAPAGKSAGAGPALAAGATNVIRPEEAAEFDLARQTIVLKVGGKVTEFSQSRVIVGRGRDVDFRVEDPNVSRRHAVVYWGDGEMIVEDLDSTNGTLVNGYPVTSTVVRSGDVLAIGDSRIVVETR